jgi:hypothetical protein
MKVYITYDRYERDEWYSIYHVTTDRDEAIKHCKEEDLVKFISYGPDDCHSFQLQEVEMTEEQYNTLMKWIEEDVSLENYGEGSSDFFKFMVDLFDATGVVGNKSVIISTDGCSDNDDIVHYYGSLKGLDTKDDNIYYDLSEELFNDEVLYEKILKDYIDKNY